MKIAVLKKDFTDRGGGAEKYAYKACQGLAARGHKITVYSETFNLQKDIENISHVKIKREVTAGFSRTTAFHKQVQKVFNADKYDFVYALSRTIPCDIFRVAESIHLEWMKVRYPAWQKLNPRHRGILNFERKLFNTEYVKSVICNAHLTRNQILKAFDYPADKVYVIRNGVDKERFYPAKSAEDKISVRKHLEIPEDNNVLMFAAANFKAKGLEWAIRTLPFLNPDIRKKTTLLILGGYSPDYFIDLGEQLGVGEMLCFEGRRENMRDYYLAADMFFYPTLYEPCANVCLEALSCGVPVLTTELNGAAELIKHGQNGYVVPGHKSLEKMRDLIEEFLGFDEATRSSFEKLAYEASSECDWNYHVDRLEELFSAIVKEKNS